MNHEEYGELLAENVIIENQVRPHTLCVASLAEEMQAVEALGRIKQQLKKVEEKRKFMVKPLQDHVKTINAEFKQYSDPLESAEGKIKEAILAWRHSDEWKQADALRKKIMEQARGAVEEGDIKTLQVLADGKQAVDQAYPAIVKTEEGKASTRKVWKYEVTDMEAVPREYLCLDEGKVWATVRTGKSIEGIRSYQEDIVALST